MDLVKERIAPTAAAGDSLVAWCVTSGGAGHETQCLGVVEALGVEPVVKRVNPVAPWRFFAPWGPAEADQAIVPPWPDLLVASGRQSIPYARMVRRRSGGRTFVVGLQRPVVPAHWLDLVWVPEHDRLRGERVLATLTTPHRLTAERLAAAGAAQAHLAAGLPRPLVTVLIGGASAAYRFGVHETEKLAADLRDFAIRHGCGLLVAPSHRTGAENVAILRKGLADIPAVVWDTESPNPYFGFVALADAFIVTCDSTNMVSEAAFTGRPLYAYPLPGGTAKFRRFHAAMAEAGALRWFDGQLDRWTYQPLDATRTIAEAIRTALATRGGVRQDRNRHDPS